MTCQGDIAWIVVALSLDPFGASSMPLDDSYPQAVVFIIGLGTDEQGAEVRQPRGTGFIVSIPSEVPEQIYLYVVTAAHGLRSGEQSWIRLNTAEGGIADVEVPRWLFHPTEDVAVRPLTLPQAVRWGHVPIRMFVDAWDAKPSLGDRVYFVGLLANMASMAERNIPMVRSGTIGRLNQTDVPLRLPDESTMRITGHLIDCTSYEGFSGAPCFVQFTYRKLVETPSIPGGAIGNLEHEATLLLGLIAGHFDDWRPARTSGDILGGVSARVNTGVGIVVPVEAIRETLELDELAAIRRNHDLSLRASQGTAPAGPLTDSTQSDQPVPLRSDCRTRTPLRS
jgi:hypothetical protein